MMLPVTTPFSDGGKTGASVGLNLGNWVVGFYVDNDKQKPIIMGSIGHTAGATKLENVETDPNPGGTEKEFTTYKDSSVNPNLSSPMGSDKKRNGDSPADSTTAENENLTKLQVMLVRLLLLSQVRCQQHSMVCLLKHQSPTQQVTRYV